MKTFPFDIETQHLSETRDWQQDYLIRQINDGALIPIPSSIIDRDGKQMDTQGDTWLFNLGPSTECQTWRIESPLLKYAVAAFAANRTQRISASAGLHAMGGLQRFLMSCPSYKELICTKDIESYRKTLINMMEELSFTLRQDQLYWRFWLPVAWYKWGASRQYEIGFSSKFAAHLGTLRIPGGPKGEAVRSEDPLLGPLDPELERPLLQIALASDTSTKRSHLQEQLAVALGLAYGRNPLSFRLLIEDDFTNFGASEGGTIKLPEIKKRGKLRARLTEVPLELPLAQLIAKVIWANRAISSKVELRKNDGQKMVETLLRPIFMRTKPSTTILKSDDWVYALSMSCGSYNDLLKNFVERHKIISPISNEPLHLNSRRMRYTFATDMVDLGLSQAELAFVLGHTDTQNVRVYFGIGARIVPHLERAASARIDQLLDAFSPPPPEMAMAAELSKRKCLLRPPVSCYLCPAFRPFVEVDHGETIIKKMLGEVDPSTAIQVEQISRRIESLSLHLQKQGNCNGTK